MIGQVISGELFAMPSPSPRHAKSASVLAILIGGPGGWMILYEPEIQMGSSIFVPDIAGWKKDRLPDLPETNWIAVVPDWICEVLSPALPALTEKRKCRFMPSSGFRICDL